MFSNVHHEDEGMHKAPLQLHILIIGCGKGGLAAAYSLLRAGHRITIIEAAHELGEVGAGIQMTVLWSRGRQKVVQISFVLISKILSLGKLR